MCSFSPGQTEGLGQPLLQFWPGLNYSLFLSVVWDTVLYADDTIIYCCARIIDMVFECLAFDSISSQLFQLKLAVNAEKNKIMLFSK